MVVEYFITVVEYQQPQVRCDRQALRLREDGQGVPVDLLLEPAEPPELYHGTPECNLEVILQGGLQSMGRHHVHLSPDKATAEVVGQRRGRPVVLAVNARAMRRDG